MSGTPVTAELTIEDLISPSQHCLFQGYTFFITQKSKEDKQTGAYVWMYVEDKQTGAYVL